MGTKIGPTYANIFMGVLEDSFLKSVPLKPEHFKRYIDDIFFIWTHGETELLNFIAKFNQVHPAITFSHTYSPLSVAFLDVRITISHGRLITKLFKKPTDNHQFLHFESSHVRHWKTGIPYSQAQRFRRICSEDQDFNSCCHDLKKKLLKRKYPEKIIDDAIHRARGRDRMDCLKGSIKSNGLQSANLVLTHSASIPKVQGILRNHYNILTQSDRLKAVFPEPPRVVYRRSKNIGDILTSSKIATTNRTGCSRCNKPRCKVCPHIEPSLTATSTSNQFIFTIRGSFNCDSSNVVYLLECGTCHMQYIGHTETPFRIRFNNHRSHAKTQPNLPLSKHVNMPGHSFSNLKVTILESGFRTSHDRELRESYLIHKFNTVSAGINENKGKLTCLSLD